MNYEKAIKDWNRIMQRTDFVEKTLDPNKFEIMGFKVISNIENKNKKNVYIYDHKQKKKYKVTHENDLTEAYYIYEESDNPIEIPIKELMSFPSEIMNFFRVSLSICTELFISKSKLYKTW